MKNELPKQQPELPHERNGTSSSDAQDADEKQDVLVPKEPEVRLLERQLKKAERRLRKAKEFQRIRHEQLLLFAEIIVECRMQSMPSLRAEPQKTAPSPRRPQKRYLGLSEGPRLFRKCLWASLDTVGVALVVFIFFKISLSDANPLSNWLLGYHGPARVSTFPPGTDFPELHFGADDPFKGIKDADTNENSRVRRARN